MTDTDLATGGGDDAFTAEEQAAFDAYERGEDGPGATAGGAETGAAAPGAPEAAPAATAPAGEPAAAPGEVVDPDADDADDPEANKGRFVRHGAFHKERERRKAVERQFQDLQERFARGDERLRLLSEAMQRPAPAAAQPAQVAEPEKVPDPNEDIFGYVKHLEAQLAKVASGHEQMTQAQKQQAEEAQAEREHQAVVSSYQQDVARFAQAEPAFAEGYQFLIQGRIAELKHFGATDAEAVQAVQADELALIQAARAKGVSPAEHVYAMAKLRGFAPKPASPAAPAAPAETPGERAARTAAGQAGPGLSLSGAGGSPAGEVTMEMLASMSEADFEAYAAKNPSRVRALMGG